MIFPKFYRFFNIAKENGKYDTTIVFYNDTERIYTGEIKDITLVELNHLKAFLDDLMKINNYENFPLKFGIYEIDIILNDYRITK